MSEISAPEVFLQEFYRGFTEEILVPDADVEGVVDRYHTTDIEQVADGILLDRGKLIAHLRPVRKNLVAYRYDVHEALRHGDRMAARLDIHASMRTGQVLSTEVQLMAEFTPDGRMCRAHQLTRSLPPTDTI
jgi:hypothetical protein